VSERETLLVEQQGRVLLVTINRPDKLNALSSIVLGDLEAVIDEEAADDEVRAVVVTGSGNRAFAAGADIGELEALDDALDGQRHSRSAHRLLHKMADLPKPIIMAVNGFALGGGCELAMAGDMIFASETAQFGQPEINLGIIPGFGGTFRLPRLVGRIRAMELLLLGNRINAQEAFRMGLVNRVCPPDELIPTAVDVGSTIAEKSSATVALIKRAVNRGLEIDADAAADLEAVYFGTAVGTEDRREGTAAFLQKRPANFRGH
jgi:enoyl-CoA hydratase